MRNAYCCVEGLGHRLPMEDHRLLHHATFLRLILPKLNNLSNIEKSCDSGEYSTTQKSSQRFGRMQFFSRRSCGKLETCFLVLLAILLLAFSAVVTASDRLALLQKWVAPGNIASSIRISSSDLQKRLSLEASIQLAAFEQFDHHKTGKLYNVSFSATEVSTGSIFQAIRLRVGSFKKYGVDINEFSLPRRCEVNPTPQRILLVYSRLLNSSLFQMLPQGYFLASPVVSVFAYDASNLNSTQQPDKLRVATTSTNISLQFQLPASGYSNLSCAYFSDNSTDVNFSALLQGVCLTNQLGTFALVTNTSSNVSSPSPALSPLISPRINQSRRSSNTWKIVVASVIGGLVVLALVSLLAFGIDKHRKNAKVAKMEYQADKGETLQTALIRNSRAPAAGATRTQPILERD